MLTATFFIIKAFALSGLRRYEGYTCPPFLGALSNQPSQRPLNGYEKAIASAWEGVCKQQYGVSLRLFNTAHHYMHTHSASQDSGTSTYAELGEVAQVHNTTKSEPHSKIDKLYR